MARASGDQTTRYNHCRARRASDSASLFSSPISTVSLLLRAIRICVPPPMECVKASARPPREPLSHTPLATGCLPIRYNGSQYSTRTYMSSLALRLKRSCAAAASHFLTDSLVHFFPFPSVLLLVNLHCLEGHAAVLMISLDSCPQLLVLPLLMSFDSGIYLSSTLCDLLGSLSNTV